MTRQLFTDTEDALRHRNCQHKTDTYRWHLGHLGKHPRMLATNAEVTAFVHDYAISYTEKPFAWTVGGSSTWRATNGRFRRGL